LLGRAAAAVAHQGMYFMSFLAAFSSTGAIRPAETVSLMSREAEALFASLSP